MSDFGCNTDLDRCGDVYDPCGVSQTEFECQAIKLLPTGPLYGRNGCVSTEFFKSIAATYFTQYQRICDLRSELNPTTADGLLDEWAQIWEGECDGLPSDPNELRATLGALLGNDGVLSCQIITQELEAAGYVVNSCGMDQSTDTQERVKVRGFALGSSPLGAYAAAGRNDECQSKYYGIPCTTGCCDDDTTTVDDVESDPCEVKLNTGYTATACGCDCVGLGTFDIGQPYFPLLNPFTVLVEIDPASPAIDQCKIVDSGLLPRDGSLGIQECLDIVEPCVISALKPAHMTIKYRTCP